MMRAAASCRSLRLANSSASVATNAARRGISAGTVQRRHCNSKVRTSKNSGGYSAAVKTASTKPTYIVATSSQSVKYITTSRVHVSRAVSAPTESKSVDVAVSVKPSSPTASRGVSGMPATRSGHFSESFTVDKVLGVGGYGIVMQVQHLKSQVKYALKAVLHRHSGTANREHVEKVAREASIQHQLHHPHIVRLFYSWYEPMSTSALQSLRSALSTSEFAEEQDEEISSDELDEQSPWVSPYSLLSTTRPSEQLRAVWVLFMQMELCQKLTASPMESLSVTSSTRSYILDRMRQLVAAVAFMHERGIVHADLKPENVFVGGDGCLRLGDFGLARMAGAAVETDNGSAGTTLYKAPELRSQSEASPAPATDVYALGVTLMELAGAFGTGMERITTLLRLQNRSSSAASDTTTDVSLLPTSFATNWPVLASLVLQSTSPKASTRPSAQEMLDCILLRAKEIVTGESSTVCAT